MVAKSSSGAPSIKAGEFKAKCLELMDRVAETGESILITKRGRPVARLVPASSPTRSLFGIAAGFGESTGDIVSPLFPEWTPEADRAALIAPPTKQRRRAHRKT